MNRTRASLTPTNSPPVISFAPVEKQRYSEADLGPEEIGLRQCDLDTLSDIARTEGLSLQGAFEQVMAEARWLRDMEAGGWSLRAYCEELTLKVQRPGRKSSQGPSTSADQTAASTPEPTPTPSNISF